MIATATINGSAVRYFTTNRFTKDGREYVIVGTTSTGRGVYDAIDTVKNDKGEYRDFKRIDLLKFCEDAQASPTNDRNIAPADACLGRGRRGRTPR